MTRWTRHIREHLAHELLFGRPAGSADGWYLKREYPQPGSKRDRVARIALARAMRKGDEFFVPAVASMIDPRTDSAIVAQRIEFAPAQDKRRDRKMSPRRDIEVAAFLHDWRQLHANESVESAVAAAAEYFGFADRVIWGVWKKFGRKS